MSPNDPKLSDRGGWRECCAVGLLGAALVTAVAVRCSAWLAVAVTWVSVWNLATWMTALMLPLVIAGAWWCWWRAEPKEVLVWALAGAVMTLAMLIQMWRAESEAAKVVMWWESQRRWESAYWTDTAQLRQQLQSLREQDQPQRVSASVNDGVQNAAPPPPEASGPPPGDVEKGSR